MDTVYENFANLLKRNVGQSQSQTMIAQDGHEQCPFIDNRDVVWGVVCQDYFAARFNLVRLI